MLLFDDLIRASRLLSIAGREGNQSFRAHPEQAIAPRTNRANLQVQTGDGIGRSNFPTKLFSWYKQRLRSMGRRLRKSDSLNKLLQRERFSLRNSKYSIGD